MRYFLLLLYLSSFSKDTNEHCVCVVVPCERTIIAAADEPPIFWLILILHLGGFIHICTTVYSIIINRVFIDSLCICCVDIFMNGVDELADVNGIFYMSSKKKMKTLTAVQFGLLGILLRLSFSEHNVY